MNKNIFPALALCALTGLGGYAIANHAGAQSAPPAQVNSNPPPPGPAPTWGHRPADWGPADWRPAGWGQRGPGGWGPRSWLAVRGCFSPGPMRHAHGWGLFYPQADKQLTTADVQILAEGILLRHGNHTWKVGNVVQNQDDTISFAFTSSGGDVIARFAMDIHTGRLRRLA
jgi:hypothetical protein